MRGTLAYFRNKTYSKFYLFLALSLALSALLALRLCALAVCIVAIRSD